MLRSGFIRLLVVSEVPACSISSAVFPKRTSLRKSIVAEGDYVIAQGRFTGHGRPAAWIAADIVRFENGKLAEHWDVLQDEATKAESISGLPMFGASFAK